MPERRTLDQKRAAAAWIAVQEVAGLTTDVKKEYRALARGFAPMIQTNGLGPSCAFLYAKAYKGEKKNGGKNAHALLLSHLESWLRGRVNTMSEQHRLTEWLMTTCSSEEYRRTTVEVIAYLNWLRRFAEGALPPEKEGAAGTTAGTTRGQEHA